MSLWTGCAACPINRIRKEVTLLTDKEIALQLVVAGLQGRLWQLALPAPPTQGRDFDLNNRRIARDLYHLYQLALEEIRATTPSDNDV